MMPHSVRQPLSVSLCIAFFGLAPALVLADVTRIEVIREDTATRTEDPFSYQRYLGVVNLTLDPRSSANARITDIEHAPLNADGLIEYSTDFKLLVPSQNIANGVLAYAVNNRGGMNTPPEQRQMPIAEQGFTYLVTGWINELAPGGNRIRLHAPVVTDGDAAITGDVRYEVSVSSSTDRVEIAGSNHLAYSPTDAGLENATLTRRQYQSDARIPIERSSFELDLETVADSNQPRVWLELDGGFEPGVLYELIYEAQDPVLSGAGMAAIRDLVSLIRYGGAGSEQLAQFELPPIDHAIAYGFSQSGRLLRQYVYDGFNADKAGRIVFDGVVPFIAGGGYGMFNLRFAMPTRTNGHHSNYLYPNDLFPFTYGESTDPYTGKTDSLLARARATNTVPKVMHIQTSNEYWLRAGSLPHTNPEGTKDAVIPEAVRFYTIGGSQHGSGNGRIPDEATSGQLPRNPNMWNPIGMSLVVAMSDWVTDGVEPPASVYPKIADGTLVVSHNDGRINRDAWNPVNGYNHPGSMYLPAHASYGNRWESDRIIDSHPTYSDHFYRALVPAVDNNNNDLAAATILPPLTKVPLATFVSWNLRNPATGAERSLARLSGGYLPLAKNTFDALANRDQRNSIEGLYRGPEDYLQKYEAATDQLIADGFLLPGYKIDYMEIARENLAVFE